jgi:predicted tellurium resistance membrane protein TerC
MIVHLQLVIGVALYLLSPKVQFTGNMMSSPILRFYTIEHFLLMVIAVILATVGLVTARRVKEDKRKFKRIFVYYLIAFLIMIASTPWPFRNLGTGWF